MGFIQPDPPRPARPVETQRPIRVRKPAQRDGIVSWSEAVATIASVDPVGNAGLLEDVRRTIGYSFDFDHPVSSSSSEFPTLRDSQEEQVSKPITSQYSHHQYSPGAGMHTDSLSGTENELAFQDSISDDERDTVEKAPCPHADCTPYPTILYKLKRRYDEDLSPMCSHLLRVHRIAPFPCGELNCERKGVRGYFMQKDLARHVTEVHPTIAALHRLRGRVDPVLLDQSSRLKRLYGSIEDARPATSGQRQPSDSDFMSLRRPLSSHSLWSRRRFSLGSGQDHDRTLPSRAGVRVLSDGASSMHVHPSSATVKDMRFRNSSQDRSSDSDVQILDEDHFLNRRTSKTEGANYPTLGMKAAVAEKAGRRLERVSRNSLPKASEPKIPCSYPGCGKMISTHGGNMQKHLRVHEKHTRSSTQFMKSNCTSEVPQQASIPNSQSSVDATQSSGPIMFTNGVTSSAPQFPKHPNTIEESVVDRSYEFSDEEEGIRPVFRKAPASPARPALAGKRPSVPLSFPSPSAKIKLPKSATPPNPPPAFRKKRSSKSQQPFTTPAAKTKPRKSIVRDVLDSEDFDELSLGEHGFILLSARPRLTPLPKSAFQVRVKQEQPQSQPASATSTTKRKLGALRADVDDETDELAEDGATPYHLGANSGSKPRPNKGTGEHRSPNIRPATKSRPPAAQSHGANSPPNSSAQIVPVPFPTPTKEQQLPAKISTPLINLVQRRSSDTIPSTSELGSSPNSRRARTRRQREAAGTSSPLTELATPQKKSWAGRTVKQEDEADGVLTPGGTLRRCGLDGFVCGRPFCFKCRSGDRDGNGNGNVA